MAILETVRPATETSTRPYHLVGIGGTGMCGLARLLLGWGEPVTGSDLSLSNRLASLAEWGAVLHQGNRAENVPADGRAVVISAACGEDNPEVVEARRRGIRVLKYAEMVGEVSKGRDTIAVAGTHGKSTTSSMVSYLLTLAGLEPSYLIGAAIPQLGSNAGVGAGKHFVVEACEFDRSFLNYSPHLAVITNIEADHLDYYRDLGEIHEAFRLFAGRVDSQGYVFCHQSVAPVLAADSRIRARIETYGIEDGADWRPRGIRLEGRSARFRLEYCGRNLGSFRLAIGGMHNVLNATAAIAAAITAGADLIDVARWLPGFAGIERRFQVLHETPDLAVVTDYAHHPTEIQSVLDVAARAYPGRRLWTVFQPHQHSRTRLLLDDFARSFAPADRVVVTDILAVRDTAGDVASVHARDLVGKILARDGRAYYVGGDEGVLAHLEASREPGDVFLFLGAGTIDRTAHEFVARTGRESLR